MSSFLFLLQRLFLSLVLSVVCVFCCLLIIFFCLNDISTLTPNSRPVVEDEEASCEQHPSCHNTREFFNNKGQESSSWWKWITNTSVSWLATITTTTTATTA